MTDSDYAYAHDIVERRETIINAGSSVSSGEISISGFVPVAVRLPFTWTLAPLTFLCRHQQMEAFYPLYDESGEYALFSPALAGNIWCAFVCPALFLGADYIKMRSGTSAAPVIQAAARTVEVLLRRTAP